MASSNRTGFFKLESFFNGITSLLREHAEAIILAFVLGLLVRSLVIAGVVIRSTSMAPSLLPGDFVLVYALPYGFSVPLTSIRWAARPPDRSDLVTFSCPGNSDSLCLKRVAGISGDRLEMVGGRLIVNGNPCQYGETDEVRGAGRILRETCQGKSRMILEGGSETNEGKDWGPVIVPPSRFYALSDNRADLTDSRKWDVLDISQIQARAVMIWLSFDWGRPGAERFLPTVRWGRVFRGLN